MHEATVWFKRSKQVPEIELRRNWRTANCYDCHTHLEYSIGLVDEGQAIYQLGNTNHAIKAGDLVTIDSHKVHACNPKSTHWSYRMLFIEPSYLSTLFDQPLIYLKFAQTFQTQPNYAVLFNDLFQSLVQEETALVIDSQLIALCESLWLSKPSTTIIELAGIKRVKELLQDQTTHDHNLQHLSQIADLSPYQLVRQFKKAYGLPPHAFQLDLRIQQAKPLLRKGMSLSQVALDLGFADQAHFQRHFKRRLALTPKAYQNCFVKP